MDTDRKKILIVEDDADERMAMHLRMKASGYETFFAIDGITSMVEAQKHRPDLILPVSYTHLLQWPPVVRGLPRPVCVP